MTLTESVYHFGVIVNIVVSSSGFILAYLAWQKFRGTPFGRVLFILLPFMSLHVLEHVLLVVTPDLRAFVGVLEVATLAWLVVFMIGMIRLHWRIRRRRSIAPRQTT